MTNSNEPISPVLVQSASLQNETSLGLTKREYFASLAMQGLISQTTPLPTTSLLEAPKNVANWSVLFADELIKSLNEQK